MTHPVTECVLIVPTLAIELKRPVRRLQLLFDATQSVKLCTQDMPRVEVELRDASERLFGRHRMW